MKELIINILIYLAATLGAWLLAYVVSFAVIAPNLWNSLAHTISIWLEGIYLISVAAVLAVIHYNIRQAVLHNVLLPCITLPVCAVVSTVFYNKFPYVWYELSINLPKLFVVAFLLAAFSIGAGTVTCLYSKRSLADDSRPQAIYLAFILCTTLATVGLALMLIIAQLSAG